MNIRAIMISVSCLGLFFATELNAQTTWDKPTPALPETTKITVYRSPSCGCCGRWLDHLSKHGFEVDDVKTEDMKEIKKRMGVPAKLASCHTAVVNDFVIEGHVPAGDIKKLLLQKPDIVGLSVPAMPAGTPGMEVGGRKDPFTVIGFDKDGKASKFKEYRSY